MAVEEVGDSFAGDDDACLPVAGGEDAQPPGLQMEGRGVPAAGQRVHDDDDFELAALQPVRSVHRHAPRGGVSGPGERGPDQVGLVAVGDADGDVTGVQGPSVRAALAGGDRSADQQPVCEIGGGPEGLGVGARYVPAGQFVQGPAGGERLGEGLVQVGAGEPGGAELQGAGVFAGSGGEVVEGVEGPGDGRRGRGGQGRQDTGSRCTGMPGLCSSITLTPFCVGSCGSPIQRSVPTIVKGSNWPGSPTNRPRSKRSTICSSMSERIW